MEKAWKDLPLEIRPLVSFFMGYPGSHEELAERLEERIRQTGRRWHRLQKAKKRRQLHFGPGLSQRELPQALEQVKALVDEYLGVQGIKTPRVGYHVPNQYLLHVVAFNAGFATATLFKQPLVSLLLLGVGGLLYQRACKRTVKDNEVGAYVREDETILLERAPRAELLATLAHEYVHHLQKRYAWELKLPEEVYDKLVESFAFGVERRIAERLAQQEGNEAFLFEATGREYNNLRTGYFRLCEILKRDPAGLGVDSKGRVRLSSGGDKNFHSLVAEETGGRDLYQIVFNALRGPFKMVTYPGTISTVKM